MGNDLTDYQAEAIANGYTHDFVCDLSQQASVITNKSGNLSHDGDALVLANDNTVEWLHIGGVTSPNPAPDLKGAPTVPAGEGISGHGIFGDNVTGSHIHHVSIAGSNQDGPFDPITGLGGRHLSVSPTSVFPAGGELHSERCDINGSLGGW